jgi:uncharacterized protein YdaU (DUF1376 family)
VPKIRRVDFYPDDWLAGTIGMSDADRGVYIQVLMGIYSHGGPIHIDDARKMCGRQFERSVERLIRRSKLTLIEQQLSSNRALTELQRATNRALKAQQNGAKGGRPNVLAKPDGSGSSETNIQQTTYNKQHIDSPNGERQSARQIATLMVDAWRGCFEGVLPIPDKLTKTRLESSRARWNDEFGRDIASWVQFIEQIRGSPFLTGDNERGWRADFDWALKPSNVAKVREGKYDRSEEHNVGISKLRAPEEPAPTLRDLGIEGYGDRD